VINQPYSTIKDSKPTSNNDPLAQVVYLRKENNKIKDENISLTKTMETLIECLSEFDHNPNIQGIGQICKRKLEEIKRGKS